MYAILWHLLHIYITYDIAPILEYLKRSSLTLAKLALLCLIAPLLLSCPTTTLKTAKATIKSPIISKSATNFTQTYSNAGFDLTLQYPTNWSKAEVYHNNSAILVVVFRTPGMLGSLNILGINHLSTKNATLPTLVDAYITHLKHSGKLLQLISSTPTNLAGSPAVRLVYSTISPQGVKFQLMQLVSIVGNKTFFVTYGSPTLTYSTYLRAVKQMIGSMKIKQ